MSVSFAKEFGEVPVSSAELKTVLKDYRAPMSRIGGHLRHGDIISLRRNLYLCTPDAYSRELIANHLSAPSYVSYETVLSNAGIIPERVHTVKSSCLGRGRHYENATGHYEYISVPREYYPEGVTIGRTAQGNRYLTARPEKALCDLILATPGLRLQSPKAAREYLAIYLRADMEAVAEWSADLVHTLAELSTKKKNDLYNLERMLRNECV